MKKYIFGLAVCFWTLPVWGFNTTLRMGLTAPATGQLDYPQQFDTMFHIIDSSSAIQAQPNTFTSSNTFSGVGSTVTISQDLKLLYVGALQCLSLDSSNNVVGTACSAGGSSSLAVFNGTSGAPGVAVSSPTGGLNLLSTVFTVALQGPSTAFISVNASSVTLQGNTFNGNSQLVQTDGAGHIPTAVIGTGVILSTGSLQSGATFYTSSGTAVSLNASTATVATLLQVNGAGLSGSQVVGQINGSAFNVTAARNVGLGTAVPGFALDEQQGTANFAFGLNTSTITVSSVTVSGKITFNDGTVQNTAPVAGAANLGVSSGSATNSVIVTSPTLNIVLDSTTFKTSLQGSATTFTTVNFKGAGLTNTILATDANGVVISTTVSSSGGGPTLIATQTWSGSNNWTTPSVSTFTYGLQAGSMTIKNLTNTLLAVDANGVVISTTAGGSGTVNTGSAGVFAYYATSTNAVSGLPAGATMSVGKLNYQNSTNQLAFTAGAQVTTLNIPTPAASLTYTIPDVGGNANLLLSTGAQTLNGLTTFTSSNTTVSTMTLSNPALANTILATNASGVIVSTTVSSGGPTLASTQTWTGTNTFASSTSIKGTTTNDNAAAGNIGEWVQNTASAANLPASGNWGDLTSISLTAGDWDVNAAVYMADNGAVWTDGQIGISNTTGNSTTGLVIGDNRVLFGQTASAGTPNQTSLSIPSWRFSVNVSTTAYLKYESDYTGGPPSAYGRISARRVR